MAAGRDRGLYLRTSRPPTQPGEASSDVCFRWTAGPDTRLLIAVVSLRMLFFDSRALQTWQVSGRARRLVRPARLDVQLARHPLINQSIAGEKRRNGYGGCDEMPDGRLINTITGHARVGCGERAQHTTCDSIDKLHDTGHAMLESDRYVTHRQFDCDTRPGD